MVLWGMLGKTLNRDDFQTTPEMAENCHLQVQDGESPMSYLR
jgi:hypothetical protein